MSLRETLLLSFTGPSGRHVGTADGLAFVRVPEAEILAGFRAELSGRIDAHAEAMRLSMITPGVGQAMEYQQAQSEAAAALKATASATADKYPMLAATIGIDIDPETGEVATDVLGVARSVLAARDAWLVAGSAIRRTRLAAKAAVDRAETIAAAEAAFAAISWPAPQ